MRLLQRRLIIGNLWCPIFLLIHRAGLTAAYMVVTMVIGQLRHPETSNSKYALRVSQG